MKKSLFFGIILIIIATLVLAGCGEKKDYTEFAQCLTDEGAVMYGAFWCPHCIDQKESFGDAWEEVNYIECSLPDRSGQTQVCKDADIQGYPAWQFVDDTLIPAELANRKSSGPNWEIRIAGEITLKQLGTITGCQLPE
ncbi:hypothetical protein HOI26_00125 [Candidatus Woesearchaeota archaeon]|jgi:hypothetical protein|nr:hypothetical protein [Candidatus Woesearchaeota archaeon]MBT5739480.1 hypothetical protein [Candidatus Woesearchaeota archaeon]